MVHWITVMYNDIIGLWFIDYHYVPGAVLWEEQFPMANNKFEELYSGTNLTNLSSNLKNIIRYL